MQAAIRDLTLAGVIVVAPAVFRSTDDREADEPMTDEQKGVLGVLHLRKIDLADRVLIVNPGGYIGESTSREIAYARTAGKPISFTDPPDQSTLRTACGVSTNLSARRTRPALTISLAHDRRDGYAPFSVPHHSTTTRQAAPSIKRVALRGQFGGVDGLEHVERDQP
jgi:hypothetical protein